MENVDRHDTRDVALVRKRAAKNTKKKPYAPPVLIRWGTFADLTGAVGNAGARDNGKGKGPKRTR